MHLAAFCRREREADVRVTLHATVSGGGQHRLRHLAATPSMPLRVELCPPSAERAAAGWRRRAVALHWHAAAC